jgi:hypothetical protein
MRTDNAPATSLLPDFLILGAARAGTTTLYQQLSALDGIYMPRHKEPSFFYFLNNPAAQAERYKNDYIAELHAYLGLFHPAAPTSLKGEASTVYLYEPTTVIRNIKHVYGHRAKELKMVISLREPVARAWSMYQRLVQTNRERLSFAEAIRPETIERRVKHEKLGNGFDYIKGSRYYEPVRQYSEDFPYCHIVLYDDLVRDQLQMLGALAEFLSLAPPPQNMRAIRSNVSGTITDDFWGILYRLQKFVGRSTIAEPIRALIPQPLIHAAKNYVQTRGTRKDGISYPRLIQQFGNLFAQDLEQLRELFLQRGLQHQYRIVTHWLDLYAEHRALPPDPGAP